MRSTHGSSLFDFWKEPCSDRVLGGEVFHFCGWRGNFADTVRYSRPVGLILLWDCNAAWLCV